MIFANHVDPKILKARKVADFKAGWQWLQLRWHLNYWSYAASRLNLLSELSVGVGDRVNVLVRNVLSVVESGTPQFCHFCPLTLAKLLDRPLHLQLLKSDLLLIDDAHHRLGKLVALRKYSPDALQRL